MQFVHSASNCRYNDGKDNVKKNWIYEKNNSSARASRFLEHFFDVHCTPTATFRGGHEHTTMNFSLNLLLNL